MTVLRQLFGRVLWVLEVETSFLFCNIRSAQADIEHDLYLSVAVLDIKLQPLTLPLCHAENQLVPVERCLPVDLVVLQHPALC